ncbi:unnamed protein product [Phytophthora fragariaefolia]|uniref:Unnamed protein product n=1 Tax=Phytophthora fragariaefolia TaxID=1490495 RepID=A0A9W7DCS9_9STRA|nr:unnamed protein product [Phytophthora fragariaefolia]
MTSTNCQILFAWVRASFRVTGEAYDAEALSICDSFDSEPLDGFGEMQLSVALDDVTDCMRIAEIDHTVSSIKNNSLPDIKDLFKKDLNMKLDGSGVNARIIEYYNKFNLIVSVNGLTECFSGNNGAKRSERQEAAGKGKEKSKAEISVKIKMKSTTPNAPSSSDQLVLRRTRSRARQKAELLNDLHKNRNAKRAMIKRLGEMMPTTDRVVVLNGVLELPYYPDSGSDHTVIGNSHWEQLKEAGPSVEVQVLETPIDKQTFGATVRSWLTDDGKFIVGHDRLTSLSIEVDRQLEQLAQRGEDEPSGDPIEQEADEMPVRVGASKPGEDADIFAAAEKLISRGVANGFPVEHVVKLRPIAHAHDVWRLELSSDPCERASYDSATEVRGGPIKCKSRKYPPHVRKYMQEFNSRIVELGLVYGNPKSRWLSSVLPVKKSATQWTCGRQRTIGQLTHRLLSWRR